MNRKVISVLLTTAMFSTLLTACGKSNTDSKDVVNTSGTTGNTQVSTDGTDSTASEGEAGEYTFRDITGGPYNTWSPTDWQIENEGDLISYTTSPFYSFEMNATKDGYDIVLDLAAEYPVDVTKEYAGNETYKVPADATEGYAWKVTMRQDAEWQDGTPITADTVEYSLQQYLNPQMKNYRASSFFSGNSNLANGKAYYENDRAGGVNYALATAVDGLTMADFSAGDDGQYVDANGNKAYFGWSVTIDNDWVGGSALTDYTDYMTEEVSAGLDALANEDGYIPITEESYALLYEFTGSDNWGNESEEELINYVFYEDGIVAETPWSDVGYVKNDDYTFTVIFTNPTTEFYFEYDFGNMALLNEELYEANKQETGGIVKSSYGTAVDKYSSYGPYKIVTYQADKLVRLEKNENWHGYKDGSHEGQYQTTAIELQNIDEKTTQFSMFLQGKLDAYTLTTDDTEQYGTSDFVYFTPLSFSWYLALNTDIDMLKSRETNGINKSIITYLDFRKALSLSIDRSDYTSSCTSAHSPAYGLLNDIYICDPDTGEIYRDSDYAQKTLCDVYGVSNVSELTGYDKEQAGKLLQSAYDQCYEDGNIKDGDIVEIEYHIYGTDSRYQKMVDYVENSLLEAAKGTSLEGRISIELVEDQDFYTTMKAGQDDMVLASWGGADMNPYSLMQCYTDPSYIIEFGFDYTQPLTVSVKGEEITKSFYEWYVALCEGEYAMAELDVRNEILAGIEKGILLNYHAIPMSAQTTAALASQRIIYGSDDYINSLVGRGGIQYMTYTMDDAEWDAYCAEQNYNLTY